MLGPSVSTREVVTVGKGVQLQESTVLHGAMLQEHTCVFHTTVG